MFQTVSFAGDIYIIMVEPIKGFVMSAGGNCTINKKMDMNSIERKLRYMETYKINKQRARDTYKRIVGTPTPKFDYLLEEPIVTQYDDMVFGNYWERDK